MVQPIDLNLLQPARAIALVLVLAGAAAAPAIAQPAAVGGGCRFVPPADWPEPTVRWTGACHAGHAEGLGVLRAYSGAQASRLFFGRLKAGQPVIGVVDMTEGYKAGEFRAGRMVDTDDRSVTIRAFAQAEAAAKDAAERFRKAGNEASAAFYLDKARQLAAQMD